MRTSLKRHSKLFTVALALVLGATLGILLGPRLMLGSGAEEEQASPGELQHGEDEHEEDLVQLTAESRRTAGEAVSEAAQAVEEAQAQVDDNIEKVRVAESRLQRAQDAVGLGSIGQETIEDAQRDYDDAVAGEEAARAELTRAESEMRRVEGLVEPGLTTQRELDEARKDATTARAALDRAKKQRAIAQAKLDRAKQLVAQDIPTGNEVDAARQDLVEAQQALGAGRARLREAQRRHDIARQRLDREQDVRDQDLLAAQELARTERELRVAESTLKAAEDTVRILSQGRGEDGGIVSIVAPVSGTVVEREAKVGQVVSSESVLFEIANIRSVFVEASLYEQDVAAVRRGQAMLVSVQAYPEIQFEGVVDSIDPATPGPLAPSRN